MENAACCSSVVAQQRPTELCLAGQFVAGGDFSAAGLRNYFLYRLYSVQPCVWSSIGVAGKGDGGRGAKAPPQI